MTKGALRELAFQFLRPPEPLQTQERPGSQEYGLFPGEARQSGSLAELRPRPVRSLAKAGAFQKSYFEDYYNRTYLLPNVIDFGSVAIDSKRAFYVWNAWLKPTTLTQILVGESDGTALNGFSTPFTYRALALFPYDAIALAEGPAKFDVRYLFQFDTGENLPLDLLGERARVLPFAPNWREPFRVTYEYKTEVIASRSGKEQRRVNRNKPRKTIEYLATTKERELRAFNRHMTTWQSKTVILPEETSFVTVQADTPEGNTVFEVGSTPLWLGVGTPVFLRSGRHKQESISEIESIIGTTVVLSGPTTFEMEKGSKIMLALYGRLPADLESNRYTSKVMETTVRLDVTPGSEAPIFVPPPAETLDDRPVLRARPNWKTNPTLRYLQPRETVDFEYGRTLTVQPVPFANRSIDYSFTGRNYEDLAKIQRFFHRAKGRAGEFYFPSWEHDLPLTSRIVAGTRTIEFEGSEIFDAYKDDTTHRAVMVLLKNDVAIFNSLIEPPTFSDGKTLLTFKLDWPQDVEVLEPIMVSWLYACRFGSDILTVEWLTRTVGQTKVNFVTLEDLPYGL